MLPEIRSAKEVCLADHIRPNDVIVCGQVTAEPLTLTRKLVAERAAYPQARVFLGATFGDTFQPEHSDHLRFVSYGAMGSAAALAKARVLDVLPLHYSQLELAFSSGNCKADVVLLQLSPGLPGGRPSLGLANDYVLAAARRARVVMAEWNPDAPYTHGAELPDDIRIDVLVQADHPPLVLPSQAAGEVESAIAAHVAQWIPDGATVQMGIGALPDAVLAGLHAHHDLGLHTGMASDRVAQLITSGVITNRRKSIDRGVSVTNVVAGSEVLYELAHRNPAFSVRPASYTHNAKILAQVDQLHAVNAALEIDLTGQVNAECVGSELRGGVGGLNDFMRAARNSTGGRAIMVLQSTASGGKLSRVVPRIASGAVTITRSDIDTVVTEFGVADLRHCTLNERAERLIAIAAPAFRQELEKAWIQNKPCHPAL